MNHTTPISTLQHWLNQHIPACESLGLVLEQADSDCVKVSCDFDKNHNHHGTMFGGSQLLLATTCAWLAVHLNFPQANGNIVIRQSDMRYLAPAKSRVSAICGKLESKEVGNCLVMLQKSGKGKINVQCELVCDGKIVSVFHSEFVIFCNN
ncbi:MULTISPECIES: YiiD C-terminal domain-containing protein [unclassified Mannheimia]|uniref:YiiD C-terminal domain-containing protein n=1 Tax=unclassified Mannheimia TaxID=2645054 RepID=UPI00359D6090